MSDQTQNCCALDHHDGVVLLTHADSDAGHQRALALLADGHRVAVTARHPTRLARILAAHSSGQMVALAADIDDPLQFAKLLERTAAKLGEVRWIMDGQSGIASMLRPPSRSFDRHGRDVKPLRPTAS